VALYLEHYLIFERSGDPPDFKPTELITQELVDALELEHIQTNIDDRKY
jgi:hypothetical protein